MPAKQTLRNCTTFTGRESDVMPKALASFAIDLRFL